jgi:hypothetical protein
MPLNKKFRKELVDELRFVQNKMKKEQNPERKLFFFSAAYGITNRTFKFSFSEDVLLADLVLNAAYQQMIDRIMRLKNGDPSVVLDEKSFDNIYDGLKLLADRFENEENIQEPLEMILAASFKFSGPGYYLHEKGFM